jgi:hypothetical protein
MSTGFLDFCKTQSVGFTLKKEMVRDDIYRASSLANRDPISKAFAQSRGNTSCRLWAFFSGSNRGANTFE